MIKIKRVRIIWQLISDDPVFNIVIENGVLQLACWKPVGSRFDARWGRELIFERVNT